MASIGDFVVYGNAGICEICGIDNKAVAGRIFKYFVLKPVYDKKATVYVPVENSELCGKMRSVLSKSEIEQLISSIADEECIWIENEADRRTAYREILSSGDRRELIKLIKALYLHQSAQMQKGKKLHIADEKFLSDAQRILHDEFAFVLGIERDAVVGYIIEQIEKK